MPFIIHYWLAIKNNSMLPCTLLNVSLIASLHLVIKILSYCELYNPSSDLFLGVYYVITLSLSIYKSIHLSLYLSPAFFQTLSLPLFFLSIHSFVSMIFFHSNNCVYWLEQPREEHGKIDRCTMVTTEIEPTQNTGVLHDKNWNKKLNETNFGRQANRRGGRGASDWQ